MAVLANILESSSLTYTIISCVSMYVETSHQGVGAAGSPPRLVLCLVCDGKGFLVFGGLMLFVVNH